MTTLFEPVDERDLVQAVRDLALAKRPARIVGGDTKERIGRPSDLAARLSVRNITGVTLYEPSELVIGAKAGTPLSEVEDMLAQGNQRLPFEPVDYRSLLGTTGAATIGGIAATNLSGPRRVMAGACRDSLIGVRLVSGHGEVVKSGGRVMKNVTGLDLVKLTCGAWGTLGVYSEVIFKVLPTPETTSSIVIDGLNDQQAVVALAAALGSPFEVSGAAHLPKPVAAAPITVVRLEGLDSSVTYRLRELAKILDRFGSTRILDDVSSRNLWLRIRDARWFANPDAAIWRLSLAPSKAPRVVDAIRKTLDVEHFYDWGGGLVWLAVSAAPNAGATAIRSALGGATGHATLIRAPDAVKATVDVFQPLPQALLKLTTDIKSSFDPRRIFNPGRMYSAV